MSGRVIPFPDRSGVTLPLPPVATCAPCELLPRCPGPESSACPEHPKPAQRAVVVPFPAAPDAPDALTVLTEKICARLREEARARE